MGKNQNLAAAARAKKDEFYTQLEDIERELNHEDYRKFFRGKVVFCNCDDPYESEFFKYFAMNFNFLGLKKLIVTCYAGSPISGIEIPLPGFENFYTKPRQETAYKVEISELRDYDGDGAEGLDDIKYFLKKHPEFVIPLEGNGDFRSAECIELLKQADVVVTNPPFSLFREFVAQLMEYDKFFAIIGPINAVTYKEIFPLIMQNKMMLGRSIKSGDREFRVPDYYPLEAAGYRIDDAGIKYLRIKGVRWYTNIPLKKFAEELLLTCEYSPEKYPKYDNYDAIEVSRTALIPCDYFADMGVPITYLDKHNPNQFEIVKFRKGDDGKDLTYTVDDNTIFTGHRTPDTGHGELRHTSGSSFGGKCNGVMGVPITFLDRYNPKQFEIIGNEYTLGIEAGRAYLNGKRMYARIFIRRKM